MRRQDRLRRFLGVVKGLAQDDEVDGSRFHRRVLKVALAELEVVEPVALRLAKELYDAAKGEGKAVTTRENTHRMADANKAFAHFAW